MHNMIRERVKRSKTGCLTCRKRKIKCDETRLKCKQCIKHRFSCEWPNEVSQSSFRRNNLRKPSVQPALTDRNITCANSLILSPQDRLSLEYFPSSTVYGFYDFFEWGALQYLVKVIAPRSKLVTRMILALSGSEMHKSGLLLNHNNKNNSAKHAVDDGLVHCTQALQELMGELSAPTTQGGGKDLVDAKLAALLFMIHYELHFTGSIDRVQTHLRGFWALISDHPLFAEKRDHHHTQSENNLRMDVSNPHLVLSCQLIGWALHLDLSATSLGASSSLLKSLLGCDNPALNPMRLYQLSRLGAHRLWEKPLAGHNMLADSELYRPVGFGWQVLLARFSIWELSLKPHNAGSVNSSSMLDNLLDLRERCCDLLHIADTSPKSPSRWTSNLEVITRFASFYWATILFYYRMLNEPHNDLHREAISKLTNLLCYRHKQDSDPRKQSRIVWCTFMAAIETQDPVHREWLVERLVDVRNVSVECEQLWSMADAILGNGELGSPEAGLYSVIAR